MYKPGDLVKFKINVSSRARKGDIAQIIGTSPTYLDTKFWYVKLTRPKTRSTKRTMDRRRSFRAGIYNMTIEQEDLVLILDSSYDPCSDNTAGDDMLRFKKTLVGTIHQVDIYDDPEDPYQYGVLAQTETVKRMFYFKASEVELINKRD